MILTVHAYTFISNIEEMFYSVYEQLDTNRFSKGMIYLIYFDRGKAFENLQSSVYVALNIFVKFCTV